jgi:hypothetical protein
MLQALASATAPSSRLLMNTLPPYLSAAPLHDFSSPALDERQNLGGGRGIGAGALNRWCRSGRVLMDRAIELLHRLKP